jgi:hypothetical protein
MPGKGTKKRTIRVDDALWEPFGEATQEMGSDRNGMIKEFMRWYLEERPTVLRLLAEWRERRSLGAQPDGHGTQSGE